MTEAKTQKEKEGQLPRPFSTGDFFQKIGDFLPQKMEMFGENNGFFPYEF